MDSVKWFMSPAVFVSGGCVFSCWDFSLLVCPGELANSVGQGRYMCAPLPLLTQVLPGMNKIWDCLLSCLSRGRGLLSESGHLHRGIRMSAGGWTQLCASQTVGGTNAAVLPSPLKHLKRGRTVYASTGKLLSWFIFGVEDSGWVCEAPRGPGM